MQRHRSAEIRRRSDAKTRTSSLCRATAVQRHCHANSQPHDHAHPRPRAGVAPAKLARKRRNNACQEAARTRRNSEVDGAAPLKKYSRDFKLSKKLMKTWQQSCCRQMETSLLPESSAIIKKYIYLQKRQYFCIYLMATNSLPLFHEKNKKIPSAL